MNTNKNYYPNLAFSNDIAIIIIVLALALLLGLIGMPY